MLDKGYISPDIAIFYILVEDGYVLSQGTPDINIDIGGWEADGEDYGGDI